jgi:hypothetical protein
MINGEPDRQLKAEGSRQLQITMQEYDLIYNYMAGVPWQTGTPSRNALETLDWMQLSARQHGN